MATLYTRQIGRVTDAVYVTGGGGSSTGTITLNLVCTYTQNTTNNTSTVTLQVKAVASNANLYFKVGSWSITGNGPTGSGGESSFAYDSRNFSSKSKTLTHGSSGNTSFSSGAKATLTYYNSVGTTATKSFTLSNVSYSLPTINVYSTLSFDTTTPTMGNNVVMTIAKANVATSGVRIQAIYDEITTTIYEGTASSYTWTVPDLASTVPNSVSKPITISIQSVKGSTYYAAKTYTINAQVPNAAPYIPSVAFDTVTDDLGAFTSFIIGHSKLTVSLKSGTAGSGASIVSYSLEIRDTNASGTLLYTAQNTTSAATTSFSMTFPISVATAYLKATITDSRGRTASVTRTVTAVSYQQPQISLTAERCQSDGTADPMGAYAKVVCNWSIAQISTDNQVSGTIDILKSTNGSSYTTIKQQSVSANIYSGSFNVITALAVSTQGFFYVTISDKLSSVTSVIKTVPKAVLPLSLYDNGSDVGAAIGQMSSDKGFHVYLETEHRNHFVAPQISAGNTAVGGYTVLCTFTITGTNMNQPVYMKVAGRNRWYPFDIAIRWWNEANTDPGAAYLFASMRYDLFYLYKVSTSTWQLLIYNQYTYENFAITDVQIGGYNSSKITIDYPASTYAAATVYPSLPGTLGTDLIAASSWSAFDGYAFEFTGNLNSATQPGIYNVTGGTAARNFPGTSTNGILEVIRQNTNRIKQIYYDTTTTRNQYIRATYDGGASWAVWCQYDVITEQGTSGNWTYRKYADGKAECWKNVTGSVAITTSYSGGFYRSAAIGAENFPSGLFVAVPTLLATVNNNSGVSIFCSGVQYLTKDRMDGVFNIHVGSGTYNCVNSFHAIGRWY